MPFICKQAVTFKKFSRLRRPPPISRRNGQGDGRLIKRGVCAVSHKDNNCVGDARYVGRTVSAVRPIPFWASGDLFGCELADIAEVDVDLLRCRFAVLYRSFVDKGSIINVGVETNRYSK